MRFRVSARPQADPPPHPFREKIFFNAWRVVRGDIPPAKWKFNSTVSAAASFNLAYLLEIKLIPLKLRLFLQNNVHSTRNKPYSDLF